MINRGVWQTTDHRGGTRPSVDDSSARRNTRLFCKLIVISGHRTFFLVLQLLRYISKHSARLGCALRQGPLFNAAGAQFFYI